MEFIQNFTAACESATVVAHESNLEGATEGLIQKFKNRLVPKNKHMENALAKAVPCSNIKDAIKKFTESDVGTQYTDHFYAKVNGVAFSFHGDHKTKFAEHPELADQIQTIVNQTQKVHKAIVDKIVNDYNKSEGKDGPWAWQDRDTDKDGNRHFKPTTSGEVKSQIRLETVTIDIYDHKMNDAGDRDIYPVVTWYFDDGPQDLYGDHAIVVYSDNMFTNGRLDMNKFDLHLEG